MTHRLCEGESDSSRAQIAESVVQFIDSSERIKIG